MNLILIRHGKAEDREYWNQRGESEFTRPLTARGQKEFQTMSEFCGRYFLSQENSGIDIIFSSPYTRCLQTAKMVSKACNVPIKKSSVLAPQESSEFQAYLEPSTKDNLEPVLQFLKSCSKKYHQIALVGHEPNLSLLIEKLISARPGSITVKKGSLHILKLNFKKNLNAKLILSLTPKALTYLG